MRFVCVQVTLLSMPQLCYPIPGPTYASLMRLTELRHLRLVTYGAHISDSEFACLSGSLSIPVPPSSQLGPLLNTC